ncbi:DUF3331 domain-containing protein [Paraburkholderia sp. GAS334]|jgi:hypothetical protein|uniref:DUF3331 domain-containing protein n=1 Tax=unclassified Paraburkholderia TaxID=2615204 RepID=UPI003D22B7AD
MSRTDPWFQIVNWLRGCTPDTTRLTRRPALHASRNFRNPKPCAMANASSISHIEWQTARTILISWSDSTLGRYQDQTWRAGFARTSGVCGLTGVPVRRGDAVFRPLIRAAIKPTNAFDMILAETLLQEEQSVAR